MDDNRRSGEVRGTGRWSLVIAVFIGILVVYLAIGFFLLMGLGDPPGGERGLSYRFSLESREPVLSPGSGILIPAIVDGNNTPVFSERELEDHRAFSSEGDPIGYAYPAAIRYESTDNGTMILLAPVNITDPCRFSAEFSFQNFSGDTFRLSPVIRDDPQFLTHFSTFPVYIRNSTFVSDGEVQVDLVTFGLSACGYDPRDPSLCKGFAGRPVSGSRVIRGLLPVVTNEYGEYNNYRDCYNPLFWPAYILNPERC